MYNIYTDEIYDRVNEESKELLEDYILEMRSQRRSEKTISQYVFDIKRMYCWLETNAKNKNVLDYKKKIFRRYFLDLMENGASGARINRQQSSIRGLLNYACQNDDDYDEYENNPMQFIKGVPKESVREIIFLTDKEITMLIDELIKRKKYKHAMLVSLAYDSGARKNELAQVDRTSFEGDNQTNMVIGKRAKKFKLRYFSKSKEIYEKYIREEGVVDGPLFYSKTSSKNEREEIDSGNFYSWIVYCRKVLSEITGEDIKLFNVHSLRHTTAQCLFDGTHYCLEELGRDKLDLNEIRLLLHHESVETTQGYIKNQDEELESALFSI
ncbi:MAG: tyrosine-type recombinase/integrase [Clostridium sp.]|uniref:tyrosine-type recombinase/integrase n=1 Tax=Clostridium sp. TaxID=1506 RepID=UPI003F3067B9